MSHQRPIPDSYWVDFANLEFDRFPTGRLLAGEYPGAKEDHEMALKIGRFLDAGVSLFIDLTEAGEYQLKPYAPTLAAAAGEQGLIVAHQRVSIPDMSVPGKVQMRRSLDSIDGALEKGETVYVHCYGGIGRTGTTIGCWLVRHGMSGRQALASIGAWRRGTPDGWRESPETEEQLQMVLGWERGG